MRSSFSLSVASRSALLLGGTIVAALALPSAVSAQASGRLNPVIAAQEKGLPVFGISHPAIMRGGRGGGRGGPPGAGAAGAGGGGTAAATPPAAPAAPMPEIVLSDVAKETTAYTRADFLFTQGTSDTFLRYMEEMKKAGASMRTHPFTAKAGIWHTDAVKANNAIIRQLNAGHVNVNAEEVSSAQEVRDVVKAMRFVSKGGTRPDTGLAAAAAYWGLTVDQYREKADVWPINKNGELYLVAIIESKEGIANARAIAAEPGVAQIFVGYGTLAGVFGGDQAAREAGSAQILAACKEYKKPCGFPTNTPAEMEQRMKEGYSAFIMQRRDSLGMGAIETGRKLSGRP